MLNDSCGDFLVFVAEQPTKLPRLTAELRKATLRYDGKPYDYGPEIGILRAAAEAYLANPIPPLRDRLLRTACLVMNYHDNPYHGFHGDFAAFEKVAQPEVVNMTTLASWRKSLQNATEFA